MEKSADLNRRVERLGWAAARVRRAIQERFASARPFVGHSALAYGAVAAAIILALSPSLFFSFGYHNDYQQWAYDSHTCCLQYPETNMLIDIGRYFGAFAQNLQSFTIHTLDDLWWWRLIGILSVAGLAIYYLYIVSLRRPPTWQNACLSVAVFTLPTMQFQAVWVAMYAFWTPPILLSLATAHLLVRATDPGILLKIGDRYTLPDHRALWRSAQLTLLAFSSMLAACFFYPMSATVVLVPAAHLLLNESKQQFRQMAMLAAVLLGSAFVALFAIHKFIVLPHLSNVPYLGEYGYNLSSDLLAAASQRLGYYLREGAYLWLGLEIPLFPALIGIASIIAVIYCAVRIYRRSIGAGELLNVLLACALIIVAVAPVLIVGQFSVTYRIRLAMNGIELLILFWLLKQLPIGSSRLASLFAALGIGCSFVDVYGTSAAAHAEHVLYSKSVANLSRGDFHSIAILRPDCCRRALGFPLRVDFGVLAPATGIFDLLIGPRYNGEAAFDVSTLVLPSGEALLRAVERNDDRLPLGVEENAVVIDTSSIYGVPSFNNISSRLATVSARPLDMSRGGVRYGPANAVDGLRNTFWEVARVSFPVSLELEFPTARALTGYSLSTVEETRRMPSSWEICVSSDRINWRRLQEMTEGQPWKNDEIRHYEVGPTTGVTGIKLIVKATDDNSILRLYEFRPEFTSAPSSDSGSVITRDVSALKSDACTKAAQDRVTPGAFDPKAAADREATETNNKPPQLLYAYRGYNIVRTGGRYVGVAQELGPMEVDAVLANAVRRPPADKFIIADDTSSLEAAIDKNLKDGGAVSR